MKTKEKVMEITGKSVERYFDVRQFDNFLTKLHEEGLLKLTQRRIRRYEEKIASEFNFPHVTVVASENTTRFSRVSAEIFMGQVKRVGQRVRQKPVMDPEMDGFLSIGLVSGSTTQRTIDAACSSSDWEKDFGLSKGALPRVKVFALNVSPTSPKEINYNATILAQRLVAKFQENGHEAEAYGLNAQVVVTRNHLDEIDRTPQTSDVLRFTEPHRIVDPSSEKAVSETETRLNIILTGAGELGHDPKNGSIFYKLANGVGLDMEAIRRQSRLVGDLGFAPLSSTGEEIELEKDEKKLVFYSAASLKIFEAMAADPDKAVILVAQSARKQRIIHASIGDSSSDGLRRRYVSHLVVDENAAEALIRY